MGRMDLAQVYYYNHLRKEILEGPGRETAVTGKLCVTLRVEEFMEKYM